MQSVDGDVRLTPTIAIDKVKSGVSKLASTIKKLLSFNVDTGAEKAIERLTLKAAKLNDAIDTKFRGEKWVNARNEVWKTEKALEEARRAQEEFNRQQSQPVDISRVSELRRRINDLDKAYFAITARAINEGRELNSYEQRQLNLLDGIAKKRQQELDSLIGNKNKAEELANAVQRAANAHDEAKARLKEYSSAFDVVKNVLKSIPPVAKSAFSRVASAIKAIAPYAAKVGKAIYNGFKTAFSKVVSVAKSALSKVKSHFGRTGKSSKGMFGDIQSGIKRGLKMLLRYGLGVRGLFVLFRKLRTAAKEGFKNLGGYSDSFNKTVSDLLSASLKLKNAFAVAFQPLASAVLPIITKIVNGMSNALTKVGEFFAAFTGQKYYYKAIDTRVKYVENKTKKTVKKLQRYLSPLDDINLFTDKDKDTTDTSDTATNPKKMFKTEAVGQKMQSLADKLKAMLKSKDWTKLGEWLGDKLNSILAEIDWKKIQQDARDFATRLFTLINGFLKAVDWTLVGRTIAEGINTAFIFLSTFINGLEWNLLGKSAADLVNGFVDNVKGAPIVSTVTGLINGIATAVLAFASKVKWKKIGKRIASGLSKMLDGIEWGTIHKAVSKLAEGLGTLITKIFGSKKLGRSLGKTIAGIFLTAINFAYTLIENIKFGKIGEAISETVNKFLEDMAKVDEKGLSGWAKLGKSLFGLAHGLLTLLTTALNGIHWQEVGQAIGDFLSSIEWGKIVLDLSSLAGAILSAIANAFAGWFGKDPVSATLATMLGTILISGSIMKKIISAGIRIKGTLDKLGLPKGASGATKSMEEVSTDVGNVSKSTSKLTSKLKTLIKDLALGIVVIAEVAIAAGVIVASIWGLGLLIQQVIIAWQPVIQNGGTAIAAIALGTGILVATGVVCAALGSVGTSLIVNMALGIAILAEIGIATALFLAEIWAIGWGLNQILLAWKPVLKNGTEVATAIAVGTGILVVIGAVCALLGVAAVASGGLLPIAIGLGIAMLAEIGAAAIVFIADIWAVGKALIKLIVPWSIVNQNGKIVESAIKQGTTILIAIGAACALLGVASVVSVGLLPIAIKIGKNMLKDVGDASVLFVTNLEALGNSLAKMVTAWQPVLKNGKTLENGIKKGTELLVAVGVVCAALGVASVASIGLLPVAIKLGTKMLQDIQNSTITFCDLLKKLAKKLTELATALVAFNAVRPTLKKNLEEYVKFMKLLASILLGYTTSALLTGMGGTINTFINLFADKPINKLYNKITSQKGQFKDLITGLTKINPLIEKAKNLIGTYKKRMGLFSTAAKGNGTGLLGKTVAGTRNMANDIIGIFDTMANSAIRAINAMIQAINALKFNIPEWIPAIGGKKFSFNLKPVDYISIPKLATGAVIPPNREFMALLGDQNSGNNIEAPENLIRKIVREESGNNTYTVNAQVGAKTLFSIVLNEAKLQQVQTGHSPFELIKGV